MAKIQSFSHTELLELEAQAEQLFTAGIHATMIRFATHTGIIAAADINAIVNDFTAMQTAWNFTVEDSLIEFIGDTYMGSGVTTAVSLNSSFFPDGAIGVPAIPNPIAEDYLKSASNRMKNFSDELWKVTQEELHTGFSLGESNEEMALRLQKAAGLAEPRAHVVARTEVHGAVEAASIAQLRAVGYTDEEMNKQWLATEDARTRPSHNLADGQIAPLSGKFIVGGFSLDHPGDTTGPASETINCRCTTLFDVDVPPPITCVNPALVSATATTVSTPDCICSTSGTAAPGHVAPRPAAPALSEAQQDEIFEDFKNGHGKISPAYSGKKVYDTLTAVHTKFKAQGPPYDKLSLFDVLAIVDERYTKGKVNGHPFATKLEEWLATPAGKKASGGLDFPTKIVSPSPPSAPKVSVTPSPVSAPPTPSIPVTGPSVAAPPVAPVVPGTKPLTAYQKWKAKKLASASGTPGPGVTTVPPVVPTPVVPVPPVASGLNPLDVMNVIKHYDVAIDVNYSGVEIYDFALDFLSNSGATDFNDLTDLKKWKAILKTVEQYQGKGLNLTPMEIARAWDYTSPGSNFEASLTKWATSAVGRKRIAKDIIDHPTLLKFKPGTGPSATKLATPVTPPVAPAPAPAAPVTFTPTKLPSIPSKPDITDLTYTGKTLGSHGAQVWTDSSGGKWLFKPQQKFLTELDTATAKIQSKAGLTRTGTYDITLGGKHGSIQYMYDGSVDAFPGGKFDPLKMSAADLETMQQEQIFDWMISNFDTHTGQWIRLPNGQLVSVDKGQAFKFLGKDKLTVDYTPVTPLGSDKLTYQTMWKNFVEGKIDLNDPTTGQLGAYIDQLMSIPDVEYRALMQPYVMGLPKLPSQFKTVDEMLDAMVARKHTLKSDFTKLWNDAVAARLKNKPSLPVPGTIAPPPVPTPVAVPVSVPPMPGSYDIMDVLDHGNPFTLATPEITTVSTVFDNSVGNAYWTASMLEKWDAIVQTIQDVPSLDLTPMQVVQAYDKWNGTNFELELTNWAKTSAGKFEIEQSINDFPGVLKVKSGAPGPTPVATPITPPVSAPVPSALPTPVFDAMKVIDHQGSDPLPLMKHEVKEVVDIFDAYANNIGIPFHAMSGNDAWSAIVHTLKNIPKSMKLEPIHIARAYDFIHPGGDFEKSLISFAKTAHGHSTIEKSLLDHPDILKLKPVSVEDVLGSNVLSGFNSAKIIDMSNFFKAEAPLSFVSYSPAELWDHLVTAMNNYKAVHGDISPLQALKMISAITTKDGYEKKLLKWAQTAAGKKKIISSVTPSPSTVTKAAAKKMGKKAAKAAPSPSTPSSSLGGGDISGIATTKQQTFYTTFKSHGADSYMSADPGQLWTTVAMTIEKHKLLHGDTLTPLQAIKIIDERGALKAGVANTHVLENKIMAWLKTADGKAISTGKKVYKKAPSIPSYSSYPKPSTPAGTSVSTPSSRPEPWKSAKDVDEFGQSMPKISRPDVSTQAQPSSDFQYITTAKAKKLQEDINAVSPPTQEQLAGLKHYTGSNYTQMNGYLRGHMRGKVYKNTDEHQKRAIIWAQEGMRPSTEDMLLFRGTDHRNFGITDVTELKKMVGKTIQDEGFTSSSVGNSAAFGGEVLFEIEAPKGSSMYYVKTISHFSSENEMLLAAGTKYKILSVTERTHHGRKQWVVRGRIVA